MTTEEKKQRVDYLFLKASELPIADRPAFLDAECANDPADVREEVERLLKAAAAAKNGFLGDPVLPKQKDQPHSDAVIAETIFTNCDDSPSSENLTGDLLPETIGRYQVVGIIGRGSFGTVYRALDPELGREVAIKVPRPDVVGDQIDVEAYLEEARTVAKLCEGTGHPSIVPVYDCGRTEDGSCFVVSKLVNGKDLGSAMAARKFSMEEAVELVATLADALYHAHQQDIVHRDVKPANILLDETGRPMLTDFGLALRPEAFGQGNNLCGTLAYMSPEQAQGKSHKVDGRSDVFSLAVVLYELLTGGKGPYRHNQFLKLREEIVDRDCEVRPLRQHDLSIPTDLEKVCLRALRKDPDQRYPTAADFATELRRVISRPTETRHVGWLAASGLAAVVVLALVLWAIPDNSQTPAEMPLRVLGMDVQHVANLNDEFDQSHGLIGKDSFAARLNDSVTIRARLSKPAYAYIIAFRPDGQEELCFPEDESETPTLTDRPSYPWQRQDVNYGLTEGTGLWLFAVVASNERLPAYNEWRSGRPPPPWQSATASRDIVLWDDGQWVETLTPRGASRGDRGKGVPAKLRLPVVQITDWLKQADGADAVAALGFAVLPKK